METMDFDVSVCCSKWSTSVLDVYGEEGSECVRPEGIWVLSILSAQFYCEHKTALKSFILKNISTLSGRCKSQMTLFL